MHVIPEGGSLAIECEGGTVIERVSFASFGTPSTPANNSVAVDSACHSPDSMRVVAAACQGQSHCCLPVSTDNFGRDPCHGKIKKLAVVVHGCREHQAHTRWKRHCSLQGQWLLCDEDIEFLAQLELPEPKQILPHVAVMVDTSWRPHIQHFVVHNVSLGRPPDKPAAPPPLLPAPPATPLRRERPAALLPPSARCPGRCSRAAARRPPASRACSLASAAPRHVTAM